MKTRLILLCVGVGMSIQTKSSAQSLRSRQHGFYYPHGTTKSNSSRSAAQLICDQFSKMHYSTKKGAKNVYEANEAQFMAEEHRKEMRSRRGRGKVSQQTVSAVSEAGSSSSSVGSAIPSEILTNLTFKERDQIAEID